MHSTLLPALALAVAFAGPCFAQTPPIPAEIRARVDAVAEKYYASVSDEPEKQEAVRQMWPAGPTSIIPLDINADGITDWRLKFDFTPAMCGTGGCINEIHVSRRWAPTGGI